MRKFSITVNGQAYEVEVEEIGGAPSFAAAPVAAPAPVAAAPAPKAAPAPAPKAAAAAPAGAEVISAPMPGNINDVRVSAGQQVKKGDILVILEAMKMDGSPRRHCGQRQRQQGRDGQYRRHAGDAEVSAEG